MSPPWMPLYIADYVADTAHLGAAESGAYLHLIMHYWRMGGLPPDDEMRRRISRMTPREWQRSREVVLAFFSSDGKHKRIDEELSRASHKSNVLRDNALKSHEARHAKAEQKQSKSTCIARALPQPQSDKRIEATPLVEAGASTDEAAVVVSISRKPDPTRSATIRAVGEWWNDLASALGFPQIDRIEGNREVAVLQRARRLREDHGTLEDGLRFMEAKIRGSPFLQGKTGWHGFSFDWCLKSSNFQKIVEGNYEREIQQARRR